MTEFQAQIIETLTTAKSFRVAKASFNGDFLNCEAHVNATVKGKKKIKKQKFSFVFDSPEDLQGCRQVGRMTGAYSEAYAKSAFETIVSEAAKIAQLEIS